MKVENWNVDADDDAGGAGVVLRDHQADALGEIESLFFDQHQTRLLVHHPTGLGKTVIASMVGRHGRFEEWRRTFARHERRILFLTNRDALIEQAEREFRRAWPGVEIAIEQGARTARDAQIVIGSVATLGRQGSDRLLRLGPRSFRIVIIDEAHHGVARSYLRILEQFRLELPPGPSSSRLPPERLLLGLTATMERADQIGLSHIFDHVAHSLSLVDMIEAGHLSRLRAYQVFTETSLNDVRDAAGDFEVGALSRAINTPARNREAVAAYLRLAAGRRTIVFAADVGHAECLAASFEELGVSAAAVHGRLPKVVQAQRVEALRRGEIDVLTNCMLLTEGFDEPQVTCIVLSRPTRSPVLYRQMIGRGTRLHPGKEDCLIIDMLDQCDAHDLQSMGTLVGLPPRTQYAGADVARLASARRAVDDAHPSIVIPADTTLEDLEILAMEVPLWDCSGSAAWTSVDENTRLLSVRSGGVERIVIRRTGDGWRLKRLIMPFRAPRMAGFVVQLRWRFPVGLPESLTVPFTTAEHASEAVDAWLNARAADQLDDHQAYRVLKSLRGHRDCLWSDPDPNWCRNERLKNCRTEMVLGRGSVLLCSASFLEWEVFGQIVFDDCTLIGYGRPRGGTSVREKVRRAMQYFFDRAPDTVQQGLPCSDEALERWLSGLTWRSRGWSSRHRKAIVENVHRAPIDAFVVDSNGDESASD